MMDDHDDHHCPHSNGHLGSTLLFRHIQMFGCFKGLEIAKGCLLIGDVLTFSRLIFIYFYEQTDWRLDKYTHTSTSRFPLPMMSAALLKVNPL